MSSDGHGLETKDGQPFLYLADTAWELFRMTTREEATQYLAARKAQGFNVVMACSHGVEDSPYDIDTPNRYGHVAFVDDDFATPQVLDGADNDYWDHVDFVIDEAARIGLYVAFLPYWARDYAVSYSCSGRCVDETTGWALGHFFGARYGDRDHLIWVIGGDNNALGEEDVMRATAAGIAEGAGRDQDELVMTYHPNGWGEDPHSSSAYFHDDSWLDSNGVQSGHYLDVYNYLLIAADYALSPPKPTLELEAVYEHIYDHFDPANHRFDDYDTRSKGYWALFAGAAGYTYGNNAVWQFYREGLEPRYYLEPDRFWYDEIDNPSAQQMLHLRNLCTSRPLGGRFPDQTLIVEGEGTEQTRAVATRGADQSYAMVYLPTPRPITVRLDRLSGETTRAWWFDPRDGSCSDPVEVVNTGQSQQFTPPASPAADWVLVLDDAASGYAPPGSP